jgi:hypothetical protein
MYRVVRVPGAEARALDRPERVWPPTAIAHNHGPTDYAAAATAGNVALALADAIAIAIAELNTWIQTIESAHD